jgi:hypothetical protein
MANKIIYWVTTGLFSAIMLFSASMYIFNHEMAIEAFTGLGFPTYLIYPMAIAKLLGLATILTRFNKTLVEWAYAGFVFNALLAASAHLAAGDQQWAGAVMALVFGLISYFTGKKVRG